MKLNSIAFEGGDLFNFYSARDAIEKAFLQNSYGSFTSFFKQSTKKVIIPFKARQMLFLEHVLEENAPITIVSIAIQLLNRNVLFNCCQFHFFV